jgi:histidinol-phosphate aminotransferase
MKKLIRPNWLEENSRDPNFYWLDKNENLDKDLIKFIKKNISTKLSSNSFTSYPDLKSLYIKLSNFENLYPNELLLTAGSDAAIRTVFQTFTTPGDKVFITNPTFAMYDVYCTLFKVKKIEINYKNNKNEISFNVFELIKKINKHKPKLVCIPNPDSPTGTFLNIDNIILILNNCKKNSTYLLIDEAYYDFINITTKKLIIDFPNLIICRTFSKAWALAGLRVGYLISSNNLIKLMNLTRPMYEISNTGLFFLEKIIDHNTEIKKSISRINKGKLYFENQMNILGYDVLKTYTNFSHINFKKDKNIIFKKLDKSVYYRKYFTHSSLIGFSRFTIAPINIMKKIVKIIKSPL